MTTSAQQMRAWRGPTILSFGFRPFFFGAAAWAVIAMGGWIGTLAGIVEPPIRFDPVSWHAHEFLFGYLGAVVAGFLLTAVPNWTGRLPIVGWPLGGLALLWGGGRVAMATSALVPAPLVAVLDLAFPVVLTLLLLREVVAGRNWRNLPVVLLLTTLLAGNAAFHWEAAQGIYAPQGVGLRLGLAAAVMMIALIGGRIVPSFTRNWLARTGHGARPVPPMMMYDKATLALTAMALLLWLAWPMAPMTGWALILVGAMHLWRLARWCGRHTAAEPLVWILHLGYGFIPVGALAVGGAILRPDLIAVSAAQHLWMAGGIGTMTLAVMTRATLGHTGQALTAGTGTAAIYLSVMVSTLLRLAAGLWPSWSSALYWGSGALWMLAFSFFCVFYGSALLRTRPTAAR